MLNLKHFSRRSPGDLVATVDEAGTRSSWTKPMGAFG